MGAVFFFFEIYEISVRCIDYCTGTVQVLYSNKFKLFSSPFFSGEPTGSEHLISTRSLLYGDGVVTAGSDGR